MNPTDNSPERQDSNDSRHPPVDPSQVPFLFLLNQAVQQQQARHDQNEQNQQGPHVQSRMAFHFNGRTVQSRSPLLAFAIGAGILVMGTMAVVALASVLIPVVIGASLLGLAFRRSGVTAPTLHREEPVGEIEVTAKRLD